MKPTVEIRGDLGIDFDARVLKYTYEDVDKRKDKVKIELDNRDLTLLREYAPSTILMARWGYPGRLTPWKMLQIVKVTGFETLTFEGNGLESILDRVERTDAYYGVTRSAIVRQIAEKRYGLSGALLVLEETEEVFDTVNQIAETDAAFLKRLAAEEGFVFYLDETGLHWHSPQYGEPPIKRIVYRRVEEGGEIIAEPRLDINLQRSFAKIKKASVDPENKGLIDALADSETDSDTSELGTMVPADKKLADPMLLKDPETGEVYFRPQGLASIFPGDPAYALLTPAMQREAFEESLKVDAEPPGSLEAKAKAKKRALAPLKIKFSLTLIGDPEYRAKAVYEIVGLPPMLEGNWYCPRCTHEIADAYVVTMDFQKQNLEKQPETGKLAETGAQVNASDIGVAGEMKIVKDTDTGKVYQYPPGFIGPV